MTDRELLEAIVTKIDKMQDEISNMQNDISELKTSSVKMQNDISELKTSSAKMQDDISELKTSSAKMQNDISELKTSSTKMQDELSKMRGEITDIRLTLENETNRNIRIIAEGHLDIQRRFTEISKVESEKEMMNVRLNIVERDIERIKKRLEITA